MNAFDNGNESIEDKFEIDISLNGLLLTTTIDFIDILIRY